MDGLHWTWGMSKSNEQWYIKVQDLDTGLYALAYYSTDDEDPVRYYESLSPDLLILLINAEETSIYLEAQDKKNMVLSSKEIENATVANFM